MSGRCAIGALAAALLGACTEPPAGGIRDLGVETDSAPARPTRVDLLAVLTQCTGRDPYVMEAAGSVYGLFQRLLDPPAGRPIADLHFGIVAPKIDTPPICSSSPKVVVNDATLRAPTGPLSKPLDWPSNWDSKWPPRWPYLTGDMAQHVNLPELAATYVRYMPIDGECALNQYLRVAAMAIDGRNRDFVRPDSLLVVLLLADGDDCSTKDPSLWDPKLWALQYGGEYLWPYDYCYVAPPGLLYPVEHYVSLFRDAHPQGAVLVAAVGIEGTPSFVGPPPGKTTQPICDAGYFLPSQRLPALVRGLNQLGSARVRGLMVEGCELVMHPTGQGLSSVADRILEIVAR